MKHCTDDDLIDYLHGELSDTADAGVHFHLAECGDCQSRYDAEAALGEMLRSSSLGQDRELPALIRAHVWASIRAAEPTLLDRLRAAINPIVAVPLAATFALLLYLGVPVVRGSNATGAPTVSAAYYLEEHAAEGQENPLADHPTTVTLAAGRATASYAGAALIDAADAATLDDLVVTRR